MGRADNKPRKSYLGDTDITGHLHVNTTDYLEAFPAKIEHSNVFTNSDTYGTGSLFISSTGENNNQPLQLNRKNVNSSTYGNGANLVIENDPTNFTASSAFDVDIEFVANNSLVNAYNGKTELRQSCGRDTGDTRLRDGYFQISPRRGAYHPSGANSGFEPIFWFLPATDKGYGWFESKGNGIYIDPTYDYGIVSEIKMINAYQDTTIINQATLTGKYARIENEGQDDSYIRSRSMKGQASLYIQSETANKNAYLNMRSNWTSGSTGDCLIDMYTANDNTGYRMGSYSGGGFIIDRFSAGTGTENFTLSSSSDGQLTLLALSDANKGILRLGNSGGSAGGGVFTYNSASGVLDLTGTNNYITMGSNGLIEPMRLEVSSVANGATLSPGAHTTDYITTSGARTDFTISLPATPNNGHKFTFMCGGGVTTLTVSALGSATVFGAPTTLAANGFFTMFYRSSNNSWYRNG